MKSFHPFINCLLKNIFCQYVFYISAFLIGAFLLSGFALFQRFLLQIPYNTQPFSYFLLIIFGGFLGTSTGVIWFRMKVENSKLTQTYSHLQELLDNANELILSIDKNGNILYANKAWNTILGYPTSNLIGNNIFKYISEKYHANLTAAMTNVLNGEPTLVELAFIDNDSNKVYVDGYLYCSLENDKPVSFHMVLKNVTSNRQNEEVLKLSASVFEYINDGIFVIDKIGHVLIYNEAFKKITGYSDQNLQGNQLLNSLLKDKEEKRNLDEIQEAIQNKQSWQGEIIVTAKNGKIFPAFLKLTPKKVEVGDSNHFIGVLSDITSKKEVEKRLRYLATHDLLTGLPNRRLFVDQLQVILWKAEQSGISFATLYIDLDGFKEINDTYGHGVGDMYLKAISKEIQSAISEKYLVARFGGDEFAVLLQDIQSESEVAEYAQGVLDAISKQITIDKHTLKTSASIGICLYSENQDPYFMIIKADTAMYWAKDSGKNKFAFYREES